MDRDEESALHRIDQVGSLLLTYRSSWLYVKLFGNWPGRLNSRLGCLPFRTRVRLPNLRIIIRGTRITERGGEPRTTIQIPRRLDENARGKMCFVYRCGSLQAARTPQRKAMAKRLQRGG